MIPLSISNALAVKIGYFNGAKLLKPIKDYAKVGIISSVVFMGGCTVLFLTFPSQIFNIFTNDEKVLAVGIPVLIIAAYFEMFDGLQTSLSGVLKGLKMTKTVSICIISGYWLCGLPLGFLLAYKFNMQLKGFWLGLAFSFLAISIIQAIMILIKFKKLKKEYK